MVESSRVRDWLRSSVTARQKLNVSKPEGWEYGCMEEYVDTKGVGFTSQELTHEETDIVFRAVDDARMRFQIKQCFYNAQMLVLSDRNNKLIYHEGYAFGRSIIAVQHGWATINGKVIDLTWRLDQPVRKTGRLKDRVVGVYPEGFEYVGVPFPDRDAIRNKMLDRGWAGSLIDDWENGWPLVRGNLE